MQFFKDIIKAVLRPFVRPLLVRIRLIVEEVVRAEVAPLHKKIGTTNTQFVTVKEYAKASVYNQIALANSRHIPPVLHLPEGPQKFLQLSTDEDGALYYHKPECIVKNDRRILLTTVPKSGTTFMNKLLRELGFCDVTGYNSAIFFTDPVMLTKRYTKPYEYFATQQIRMPLLTQLSLVLPGMVLTGHFCSQDLDVAFHYVDGSIAMIRDLRYALVSHCRMRQALDVAAEIEKINGSSPNGILPIRDTIDKAMLKAEDLLAFIGSPGGRADFAIADGLTSLVDRYNCFIRFENIMSDDEEKIKLSLDVVVRATGKSNEEVASAFAKIKSLKTSTYTGRHSTLDGIWTPEVEAAFVAAGGDVINEKLGYSRIYQPLDK